MSIFTWGVQSLVSAKPEEPKERYNPRPPGVIRDGSATAAVLAFLLAHRGKRFSPYQIIHHLGCTEKAASWAFLFLRRQGLVEVCPDPRNERYMRYGCNEKTASAQVAEPRVQARKKGMARDEAPMSGAGFQGLAKVRRSGDSDRAAVGGELRSIPGGRGPAADNGALAGQARHLSALRAGQCDLDAARPADEPQAVLSEGDREGQCHHTRTGRKGSRAADTKHSDSPMGIGIQPGTAEVGQAVSQIHVVDLSGADPATARVGQTDWIATRDPIPTDQEGYAA